MAGGFCSFYCACTLKVCVWQEDLSAWLMLSLKLAPGTNPPLLPPPCAPCVCIPHSGTLEGLRVGVELEAQMGPGDLERKKRKVCRGGNNRRTCIGGYKGVINSAQAPSPNLLKLRAHTVGPLCQCWGVNTTDQIHLKIREPTHSATPTRGF